MHWSEDPERNLALDAVERSIARLKASVFHGIVGTFAPGTAASC
jgi:hypothetical protein